MIYLVKGAVSDPEAYGGRVAIGQIEWQFSDGLSGERGSSADYCDLAEGLADHAGCEIDISEADLTADEMAIFCGLKVGTRITLPTPAGKSFPACRVVGFTSNEIKVGR